MFLYSVQNQVQEASQDCVQIGVLQLHICTPVCDKFSRIFNSPARCCAITGRWQRLSQGKPAALWQRVGREWTAVCKCQHQQTAGHTSALLKLPQHREGGTDRKTEEELLTRIELHAHSNTLLLQLAPTSSSSHWQLNLGFLPEAAGV